MSDLCYNNGSLSIFDLYHDISKDGYNTQSKIEDPLLSSIFTIFNVELGEYFTDNIDNLQSLSLMDTSILNNVDTCG